MNKQILIGGALVLLFLVWRNGYAAQQAQDANLIPANDPYAGINDLWSLLNSASPNAQPPEAWVDRNYSGGFGGVGTCPPGAFC